MGGRLAGRGCAVRERGRERWHDDCGWKTSVRNAPPAEKTVADEEGLNNLIVPALLPEVNRKKRQDND